MNNDKPVWAYNPDTGVLVGSRCGCQRCRLVRARAAAAELARIASRERVKRGGVLAWFRSKVGR